MSALIPGEQRQAVLLDGEPLEDVEKLKFVGSLFVANGQSTEEISSRINLARSASPRLQSSLLYQAVVRSILLCRWEKWSLRVADESMLEEFDNDSIRRIVLLVQRMLRWFGHAARRLDIPLCTNVIFEYSSWLRGF